MVARICRDPTGSARTFSDSDGARAWVPWVADDEALNRAAKVSEQFRPVELTAQTVTRPGGPHTRTVHSFLRHLHAKGVDCVPEPVSLDGEKGRFGSSRARAAARVEASAR